MLGVVMVKNSLPSLLVTLSITVPVPSGVRGLRAVLDDVEDDEAALIDLRRTGTAQSRRGHPCAVGEGVDGKSRRAGHGGHQADQYADFRFLHDFPPVCSDRTRSGFRGTLS